MASTRKASRKSGRKGSRKSCSRNMSGGSRKVGKKMSKWTDFVKKIFKELKKKNKDAKLGDAMKEASRRKSEM